MQIARFTIDVHNLYFMALEDSSQWFNYSKLFIYFSTETNFVAATSEHSDSEMMSTDNPRYIFYPATVVILKPQDCFCAKFILDMGSHFEMRFIADLEVFTLVTCQMHIKIVTFTGNRFLMNTFLHLLILYV